LNTTEENDILQRINGILLVLIFILGPFFFVPGETARAAGPDFSSVNDILQGRRTLFPTDDIIVTQGGFDAPTITTILQTTGGAIASQTPHTIVPRDGLSVNSSVTASARMFDLPRYVVVTVTKGETNLLDQTGGFTQSFTNSYTGKIDNLLSPNTHAVTDFTGNGFAGIVFPDVGTNTLITMTAADTNDLSQGFFYGTPVPVDLGSGIIHGLAAGDFDGDGGNEIALAYNIGSNITVAIYRPNATTNPEDNKVTSLSLQQGGSISVPFPSVGNGFVALTAGRYGGLPNPRIVLVYTNGSQTNVQPITVTPTSNPAEFTLTLSPVFTLAQDSTAGIFARSGYLDFFDNAEQVVLEVQSIPEKIFDVLTFDNNLNATLASSLKVPTDKVSRGMVLGNFDQPNAGANPLSLQIAELSPLQCGSDSLKLIIQIYDVDPAKNFALSPGNSAQLGTSCYDGLSILDLNLATGDTQGRSLQIGPPSKLVAQHTQPEVVLGAPPMHVDYMTPANGTQPEVLNLSGAPHGFYSSYQTKVTGQAQSSRQGTTSYTNAVKASASAGFSFGTPLTGSISAKMGVNAGFMNKKFVQKQYSQYTSTSFDASTNTGFDDQVWFNSELHNIYIYPILGHVACPAEKADCTPSEKLPLAIMFSGPSQQSQMSVGGSTLEWYQPVHEVGNIFSYPWNFEQLKAVEGNIDLLTSQDPTSFSTDSSTHTATATWSGQTTSSKTSGSTSNISWGASASFTEKPGIFGGVVGNQDFSYNGSKAISTINTMTTKLGESTGIGIVKPGTFPNPDEYEYPIMPYILGDKPAAGTVQTIDLATGVQTNGILRAAFTADPTDPSAGAWWQGAYSMPDVALAHPARWVFQVYTPSAPQPNCIPVAATSRNQDCVSFNKPQSDIWTSEFHWMKGLLMTPAGANGEGPQINTATAGEEILLQARVYNYSLEDMPSDSGIIVRFYGQPWNPNTLKSAGKAFLIEEVLLEPLPGFNSVSSEGIKPNWAMASTAKLDTSDLGDQYLAFWILVFMKDAENKLVGEMPGHGLTGIPPALTDISDAVPYIEPYSNNLGFYKSLFYVKPKNSAVAPHATKTSLRLNQVKVSASQVLLGQPVVISGLVHSSEDFEGLSILFFDGDPRKQGKLFDVEGVSHIRANGSHLVKTVYHADSCGTHTLYLRGLNAAIGGQAAVNVTIDVNPPLEQLRTMIEALGLKVTNRHDLYLRYLEYAQEAFDRNQQETGLHALQKFKKGLELLRGKKIPTKQANIMLGILDQIFACVD
jgi:hypothetical protein